MALTVHTGWRSVTPGNCRTCGCDDDWECDGRGAIYCSCDCCPACGEFDGHASGCPDLMTDDEIEEFDRQLARGDFSSGRERFGA